MKLPKSRTFVVMIWIVRRATEETIRHSKSSIVAVVSLSSVVKAKRQRFYGKPGGKILVSLKQLL